MRALLEKAQKEQRKLTDEEAKEFEELRALKAQAKELRDLEEEDEAEAEEEKEEKSEDEPSDEEEKEEEEKSEDEPSDEEKEEETEESKRARKVAKKNKTQRGMKKNEFSLLRAVRAVVEGSQLDERALEVINAGKAQMRSAGLAVNGKIVLPSEMRGVNTTNGANAIETELVDVLAPLYNNKALNELGVTMMTGIQGNLDIASYSGSSATWEKETATAKDGTGIFTKKTLTPKRMTVKIPISKQFLAQDTKNAEAILRNDILEAINHKLEATLFSAVDGKVGGAGDDKDDIISPAGLFNGITAQTAAVKYADVLTIEENLEKNKFFTDQKYLLSIEAKTKLRAIGVGDGTTSFQLVYQNGEVLGTRAVVSGNVLTRGMILADWKELVVAQFGAIDLVVDPYTLAADGQIQLVVNAYFDAKFRRDNAYSAIILKA